MTDTMTIQDKTYNNKGKTMMNKQQPENRRVRKEYQATYYLKNIDRLKEYKRNWYQSTRKESK
jgi:hypothetical protein